MDEPAALHTSTLSLDDVVVPRRDLLSREIDGELVLCPTDGAEIWLLDAASRLTWQAYDGTSTLRTLSEQIAEADGAAREEVEAAVLATTRRYGAMGLLTNVETTAPVEVAPAVHPVELSRGPGACDPESPETLRLAPEPDT